MKKILSIIILIVLFEENINAQLKCNCLLVNCIDTLTSNQEGFWFSQGIHFRGLVTEDKFGYYHNGNKIGLWSSFNSNTNTTTLENYTQIDSLTSNVYVYNFKDTVLISMSVFEEIYIPEWIEITNPENGILEMKHAYAAKRKLLKEYFYSIIEKKN